MQCGVAFRSALRRFLARTDEVASAAARTLQRYDLLLAIKSVTNETSTVSELSERMFVRRPAVTELVKRAEEAALTPQAESAGFRAFVHSQDEVAR